MVKLFHDSFQNYKVYQLPKAQLVIADIPFNLGNNAYASNPVWYNGGDNRNGESSKANKKFFTGDDRFRLPEFFHFCSRMLKPEPKETGQAPALVVFCAFEQMHDLIQLAKENGFNGNIPLIFRKNYSPSVLKANMKIVCNCEYGVVLYREKLPKFNNGGKMIFNCIDYPRDTESPKIHPTQKGVHLLQYLIKIFTDEGDVVFDPCAGSGSTLMACRLLNRDCYGFEINRDFYEKANAWITGDGSAFRIKKENLFAL